MGSAQSAAAFRDAPVEPGSLADDRCIAGSATAGPLRLKLQYTLLSRTQEVLDEATGLKLFTLKGSTGLGTVDIVVTDASGALVCIAYGKLGTFSAAGFGGKVAFSVLRPVKAFANQPASSDYSYQDSVALYPFATCDMRANVMSWQTTAAYYDRDGTTQYQALRVKGVGLEFAMRVEAASPKLGVRLKALQHAYDVGAMSSALHAQARQELEQQAQGGALLAKVAQRPGTDSTQRIAEVGAGVDLLAILLLSTPLWAV